MKPLLIISTALFLMSCHSQQDTNAKNDKNLAVKQANDSIAVSPQPITLSFLDSVAKQYELSTEQIRKHTLIDSVYYTGMFSRAAFEGDTVFNFHNGFIGAIINYSDRMVCSEKYLLVFNTTNNQNTDYKIVYTDCDQDESSDYFFLRYKLINDSIFETIETFIPANSEGKAITYKKEIIKWKLNSRGVLDSIR